MTHCLPVPLVLSRAELPIVWLNILSTSAVLRPIFSARAIVSASPASIVPISMFNTSFIFVAKPISPDSQQKKTVSCHTFNNICCIADSFFVQPNLENFNRNDDENASQYRITMLENSRLSRMQQHKSWPEQGGLIILHQCCINFTGFRCVNESPSSWLWSPSSAFVVWCRPTWLTCASPFRRSSAGGSCGRLTAGHSSCYVPGLRSVGETSLCPARPYGTVSPSNCGLHHCLPGRLQKTLKLFIRLLAPLKTFV